MDDWRQRASESLNVPVSSRGEWAQKKFYGDPRLAVRYLPVAYMILGAVENQLALGGISYGVRRVELPDGAVIRVIRNFEDNIIEIDVSIVEQRKDLNILYGYTFYPRNSDAAIGWILGDDGIVENVSHPFDYKAEYDYATLGILSHFQDSYTLQPNGQTTDIKKSVALLPGLGNKQFSGNQFAYDPDNNDVYSIVHSPHGDLGLPIELILPSGGGIRTNVNLAVRNPPNTPESFYMPYARFDAIEGRWKIQAWVLTENPDKFNPSPIAIELQNTPPVLYRNGSKLWELPAETAFAVGVGFYKQTFEEEVIKSPILVYSNNLVNSLVFRFSDSEEHTAALGVSAFPVIHNPVKFSASGQEAHLIVYCLDFVALVKCTIHCDPIAPVGNRFSIDTEHQEYRLSWSRERFNYGHGMPASYDRYTADRVTGGQVFFKYDGQPWPPTSKSSDSYSFDNNPQDDLFVTGDYPFAVAYDGDDLIVATITVSDNKGYSHTSDSEKGFIKYYGPFYFGFGNGYVYLWENGKDIKNKTINGIQYTHTLNYKDKTFVVRDYLYEQTTILDEENSAGEFRLPSGTGNYYINHVNKLSVEKEVKVDRAVYFQYLDIAHDVVSYAENSTTSYQKRLQTYVFDRYLGYYYLPLEIVPETINRSVRVVFSSDTVEFNFEVR
jgi:hypothetical protein